MLNIWIVLGILFLVSLLISSIGFKKFVWFLSIGYGFSILGCGIAIGVIYGVQGHLNITGLIACVLLVIYGFRLGGFLAYRELKVKSYKKTLEMASKTEKPIPVFVLIFMWILCALLYMGQASGIAFVLQAREVTNFFDVKALEIVGVCVMAIGIFIEALADHQKSQEKKVNSNLPAMHGLYKISRCPNYYGEILCWTGVLVFFLSACTIALWFYDVIVGIAYISIVYVMMNGAKRLEIRQDSRYKDIEECKKYFEKTPILIYLFIPIHSLKNSKIIK